MADISRAAAHDEAKHHLVALALIRRAISHKNQDWERKRGRESFLDEKAWSAIDAMAKCRVDLVFQPVG